MVERTYGDLTLLQFEQLSKQGGLAHAITTRPQNYAPHRGIGREHAIGWRRQVCEILGVCFNALTSPEQIHGSDVLRIEAADVGCGRDGRSSAVRFVDGLITDRRDVPLILLSADCPLVAAYDPVTPALGAVHASWRGTVAGAAEHLVLQMRREFGSDPGRLLAAIAPSAGPCCYEVGSHVRRIAAGRMTDAGALFHEKDGRIFFDLWGANRRQLIAAGVDPDHIEVAGLCSLCDERFWSHRRDGADAGRFALVIALR